MRTVANHIALGAQNSILQRDAVENPGTLGRNPTRTIHHSTSGEPYVNSIDSLFIYIATVPLTNAGLARY